MTERGRRSANVEAGWAIDTLLIHGNQGPDAETGAVVSNFCILLSCDLSFPMKETLRCIHRFSNRLVALQQS